MISFGLIWHLSAIIAVFISGAVIGYYMKGRNERKNNTH